MHDHTQKYTELTFRTKPRAGCLFFINRGYLFCTDEARILDSLPYNMKRDVALAVHITTLSKVSVSKKLQPNLISFLLNLVKIKRPCHVILYL